MTWSSEADSRSEVHLPSLPSAAQTARFINGVMDQGVGFPLINRRIASQRRIQNPYKARTAQHWQQSQPEMEVGDHRLMQGYESHRTPRFNHRGMISLISPERLGDLSPGEV